MQPTQSFNLDVILCFFHSIMQTKCPIETKRNETNRIGTKRQQTDLLTKFANLCIAIDLEYFSAYSISILWRKETKKTEREREMKRKKENQRE